MARKKAAPVLPARAHLTPRGGERDSAVREGLPLLAVGEGDPWVRVAGRVRTVPDFPSPGSTYRDITPLLSDPVALHMVLDALSHRFIGERIDVVVGLESRGFIFGGAMAARLNAGFVPIRRAGRLPAKTDRVSYSQEFGEFELEMHRDALNPGQSVLIVDDLLATGATAAAACELVERQDARVACMAFVLELTSLGGRERLKGRPVVSVLRFD
jgi:adenine phosphoribosyltransferase